MELDRKRVGFVREMARKYLTKYKVRAPGTPVEEIIRQEGLRVEYRPWGANGISGLTLHKMRVIAVNSNKPRVHQRFSLAHEFGHYTLNHDYFKLHSAGNPDIDHPPLPGAHPVGNVIEQEANEFAGEFLVPLQILKERLRYEKKPENLAAEFDVSRDVIVITLMKHHLIR